MASSYRRSKSARSICIPVENRLCVFGHLTTSTPMAAIPKSGQAGEASFYTSGCPSNEKPQPERDLTGAKFATRGTFLAETFRLSRPCVSNQTGR